MCLCFREDRVAQAGLDAIMREYVAELTRAPTEAEIAAEKLKQKKDAIKPRMEGPKDSVRLPSNWYLPTACTRASCYIVVDD